MVRQKTKRTCKFGHTFYKSTDCPTCPTCEKLKEPSSGFLAKLSNPARNALIYYGIDTIQKLSAYSEKEILNLHGIGKASLPIFRKSLEDEGLTFKQNDHKKIK
ncbi:RNA polymerase alpha subunit C-terminal domain-containing protein [Algoriphagus sp. AGSA1]|uniref:RNA polymerase alpha subunit C-terminal domain-containing protein n=1 Tax=Algoriphagus sp. AGSA1 TaxID=2907213 RepID=UPI001F2671F5|nr:RNA polymerase alpha subunit C-terminal domain-containing protein [Algoriphagus sp. AGSA1]MCE7057048.1 RNA polymerase alpha subunit C-terminal domain-containing protein [Algoriphagus sp. AGSA1]